MFLTLAQIISRILNLILNVYSVSVYRSKLRSINGNSSVLNESTTQSVKNKCFCSPTAHVFMMLR